MPACMATLTRNSSAVGHTWERMNLQDRKTPMMM